MCVSGGGGGGVRGRRGGGEGGRLGRRVEGPGQVRMLPRGFHPTHSPVVLLANRGQNALRGLHSRYQVGFNNKKDTDRPRDFPRFRGS